MALHYTIVRPVPGSPDRAPREGRSNYRSRAPAVVVAIHAPLVRPRAGDRQPPRGSPARAEPARSRGSPHSRPVGELSHEPSSAQGSVQPFNVTRSRPPIRSPRMIPITRAPPTNPQCIRLAGRCRPPSPATSASTKPPTGARRRRAGGDVDAGGETGVRPRPRRWRKVGGRHDHCHRQRGGAGEHRA